MAAAAGESDRVTGFFAADAAATESLGAQVAARAAPGLRVFLDGELGAGKTTFVRGFLRAIGHDAAVRSPTFTLVESYATRAGPVYHFDLYRLAHARELEALGYRDYFDGSGICVVEWAQRAGTLLGVPDLQVTLAPEDGGRKINIEARTDRGRAALPPVSG